MLKILLFIFVGFVISLPISRAQMHMGSGPRGQAMMMGMGENSCAFAEGDMKVENIKDGVRITMTSNDKETVRRLQKRAKILELKRELHRSYQKK